MTFLKKPLLWIIVVILIVAVFVSVKIFGSSDGDYEMTKVERGDVVQEVSVTGRVKSSESVDLAFEKSGRVAKIFVSVGDEVKTGQTLANLSNSDLAAQVLQAQASYEKALAQHEELLIGTRPEELQIARTKVENAEKVFADARANLENVKQEAEVDLDNQYDDLKDVLSDSYLKADDALNKQIDELFYNDTSAFPKLTFSVNNYAIKDEVENKRKAAGDELAVFKSEVDSLPSSQSGLDQVLTEAEAHLNIILAFTIRLGDALNNAVGLDSTTLTNYKYYTNTGRTNINAAITNLSAQEQSIVAQKATNQSGISTAEASVNTAQNSLNSAKDDLNLKEAGATTQELAASAAGVKYAKANVESYQAEFLKTV
ncbi:MAG: biotin/lipoyl-binding protein, partial [Candidatus Portnoybacteria bacterium]|nr:biotin/lipoyl-binding protein [Candidatus Portnoybacteria bacterium]